MENEDICLYPTIFHDGIGRYCNQLVTNLSIDYKISKYSYMSPFQLFEKINKQYKVIHCPHILVNKDMRINTKSIVTTIHDIGPIVLNNLNKYQLKYYKYRLQKSLQLSDHLIFDSQAAKDDFFNFYNINKPYNVINLSSFTKSLNINANNINRKDIIHVGRRNNHKNILNAIEAFALIVKKVQDNFILIGKITKNDKKIIELVDKYKLNERIIFKENISDEQLIEYYQKSKCLFFPSLYEGYGLPVIEAMSHECPLLLSNINVFKEITNNFAYFADPNSVEEMAEILLNISLNENYATRFISKAKNFIDNRNWKDVADETYNIYKIYN